MGNQLRCFCHGSISDIYIENNYLYFAFAIRAQLVIQNALKEKNSIKNIHTKNNAQLKVNQIETNDQVNCIKVFLYFFLLLLLLL